MSTKRIVATVLWFLTGWMLGSMAAFALDLPTALAPIAGTLVAIFVFADPARLMWAARTPAPAPLMSLESSERSSHSDQRAA